MQDGLQRVEPEGAVHQDRESTQSATGDRRQDVAEDGEVVLGVVETCSHLTPFPRMLFPSTGWKSDQALSSDCSVALTCIGYDTRMSDLLLLSIERRPLRESRRSRRPGCQRRW